MNTMMILPDVIEVEVVEDIKTGLALFRTIPHMVCLLTTPLPQLKMIKSKIENSCIYWLQ